MTGPLVKLTIVTPADLENMLIESLLEMEPPIGAFTATRVDGHGQSFSEASMMERVSGRAARLTVTAVVPPSHAKSVVEYLKAKLQVPHAVWWIEPILEFGKFQ